MGRSKHESQRIKREMNDRSMTRPTHGCVNQVEQIPFALVRVNHGDRLCLNGDTSISLYLETIQYCWSSIVDIRTHRFSTNETKYAKGSVG